MPAPGDLGSLTTKNWENLQELADSLEEAWKKGNVDLVDFLPPPGAAARAVVLQELIKTDLECRWRHGHPVVLDYYLERFAADLGPASSIAPALIYEEYRVRQIFGDKPPLPQLQARFPNQFADVERLLRASPLPSLGAPQQEAPRVGARAEAPTAAHGSFGKNIVLPQTGGYTLLERIGTGGFAEVWKAKAPGGVLKAIKIIVRPLDQEEAQREKEAMELIKNLRHHFLMPIHLFWALEDRLIILMDLADGSLRDCLNKYRKEGAQAIPPRELLKYFRQAAEALDYLHEKKVQHRDIKPENILLTEGHVRVADFGLAKAQGTQRMMSGTFAGTPLYMPPETWEDKTHIHGDQYSLAATFFELRTGRRLYKDAGLPALMHSHLHETPCLDPLGKEEQQILLRALAKNPEERYPDCQTFVHALVKAVAHALPAASAALPAAPGSPTTTESGLLTLGPGADAKPVGTKIDTVLDNKTLEPSPSPASRHLPAEHAGPADGKKRSFLGRALAVVVILGLCALPAWIAWRPAPDGGDLTLLALAPQTVRAGQSAEIAVSIRRENFTEPVQLKFTPDVGISVAEANIPGSASSARVTLRIADRAALGPHRITMEACGGTHCAYHVLEIIVLPRED